MRVALIADAFPPMRTSGAVQLRDLAREFARQGHVLTVFLPSAGQQENWRLENFDGVQILRLKAPPTKDVGYVQRTLAEFVMPFVMLWQLRKTPLANQNWDGVVWYAPSIFHGPFASVLKKKSGCKAYLIIRDIFPEWAVDMGLMARGLPYWFFSLIAKYQYSVADVIGVQTLSNQRYFVQWRQQSGRQLEVLQNWLAKPNKTWCSIRINQTTLAGRKLFVYAGNMGVAQGVNIFLDLAAKLRQRTDIGFLFVGRGSDLGRLLASAREQDLDNVLFFDEIDPDEIPDLYSQCCIGIVSLDPRHKSHNIPGKFLTYMQNGLPVLANINAGNDLAKLIRDERVGQVCETNDVQELVRLAESLLEEIDAGRNFSDRCQLLFEREFSVQNAVSQIVSSLASKPGRFNF